MITGTMLTLIAWGVLLVFIFFGFLVGFIRGFRKSMYFTIIYVVTLVLSFVAAIAIAKSLYSGPFIWNFIKVRLPSDFASGCESAESVKEFVRLYIVNNFTQVLESGVTAGESIVANTEAMAIIDGFVLLMLNVVLFIATYIILSIVFFLIFGLIYLLFLRQKAHYESITIENEDGTEIEKEVKVKPKKRRLFGGLVGGLKGFVKAMVLLIPISSLIGIVATLDIAEINSASNSGYHLESSPSDDPLKQIIEACKEYDNSSVGKMYQVMSFGSKKGGLDDVVMDAFLQIKVDKETKIVLRQELVNILDIYNAIENTIGINNISSYDFEANMNSKEMVDLVKQITASIGNSGLITTTLSLLDEEAVAIAKGTLTKNDPEMALLFDELQFSDKNPTWWKTQLSQVGEIYEAFANMGIDFKMIKEKDYNGAIANLTTETFDNFLDSIFDNELLDMMISGALRYSVTKLPEDFNTVSVVIDQLVTDKEVDKEIKTFSRMIDIIKEDVKFVNGSVDLEMITLETLQKIVNTNILADSRIADKVLSTYISNTLSNIEYDGKNIGIDKQLFNDASFKLQNELYYLTETLIDGFSKDFSLKDIMSIMDNASVGNICGILESANLQECMLCKDLINNLIPIALEQFMDSSELEGIVWQNEYTSVSRVLKNIFGNEKKLAELGSFNFDDLTVKTIDDLAEDNGVWNGLFINKLLNSLALPFVEGIEVDGKTVGLDVDKNSIKWNKELKAIANISLAANGNDLNGKLSGLADSFGSDISISLLEQLVSETDGSKGTVIIPAFADGLLKALFDKDVKAKDELPQIVILAKTLAVDNKINLSDISTTLESGIKDETLDALKITATKSVIIQDIFADTLVSSNLISNKSDITNWNDEMDGLITVAKTFEDSNGLLDLNSLSSITEIKLETIEALPDNVSKSQVLMSTLSSSLKTNLDTPEMDTWTKDDWDSEISPICDVMKTLVNSNKVLNVNDLSNMDTISDATLSELQISVPRSKALQNMFGSKLEDNNIIDDKTNITDWQMEMDGLVPVAKTFENSSDELVLNTLTSITKVSIKSINNLGNNVYKSYALMKIMSDTLATPMHTPTMSSWTSLEWQVEMPLMCNVMKTLVDDVTKELDISTVSSITKVKDATLTQLKGSVPGSTALQNMFGVTLEDNGIIDNKANITNWTDELDGLVAVARTLENNDKELSLSDISTITSISLETIKLLGTNVYKSYALMSAMSDNLKVPMNTLTMSSWTSLKWKDEMPHMANLMATMVSPDSGLDKDRKIDVANIEIDENSELKKTTFASLKDDVPYSEALQNMFSKALRDSLYDSANTVDTFPSQSATYDKSERFNWWNDELDGFINVVYAFMGENDSIKLSKLSETEKVKVSIIRSLISDRSVAVSPERFSSKTTIGKSLYIQYLFKPELRDVSKRSDSTTYDFTSYTRWDIEIPKLMELLIKLNADVDDDGVITYLTDDDLFDFTLVRFDLYNLSDGITGKACVSKNKVMLSSITEAIDNNTYLQFTIAEKIDAMQDSSYPAYKTPFAWHNTDWNREMLAITNLGNIVMNDTNPDMSDSINLITVKELYGNDIFTTLADLSSKSYIVQSKIAKSLDDIGINECDASALTSVSTISLLEYVMSQEIIGEANLDFKCVVDALCLKVDILTKLSKGFADWHMETSYVRYSIFTDSTKTVEVAYILYNVSTEEFDVLLGDGSNYFTYPTPTTTEELITSLVERGTLKKPLKNNSNPYIRNNVAPNI